VGWGARRLKGNKRGEETRRSEEKKKGGGGIRRAADFAHRATSARLSTSAGCRAPVRVRTADNAECFPLFFPLSSSSPLPPDGERLTIALCTVRVKPRVLSWWAYPRALLDVCTLTIPPTRKRGSATLVARHVTEESRKQETCVKPIHRYVRQT